MRCHFRAGQSLIEVLIAVAIFVMSATTVGVLLIDASQTSLRGSGDVEARQYAIEGLEATRAIRDLNFSNVTTGTHGLAISGGSWTFVGTSDTQDGFNRSITVTAPDANTRYVTSTVIWTSNNQTETTAVFTILTNWTVASNSGNTNWATAYIAATTTLAGTANITAIATSGTYLYLGRANSAATPEFVIMDISSSTNPIQKGTFEIGANVNDIKISQDGQYAYLGTANTGGELRILNVTSSTNPVSTVSFNLANNGAINDIAVSSTTIFVARSISGGTMDLQSINVATPGTPFLLGSDSGGNGKNAVVLSQIGTPFAFIASKNTSQEFQCVNITAPGTLVIGGGIDMGGTNPGLSMAVSGTTAFFGMTSGAGHNEFYTVNIASPTTPATLGTLIYGTNVNDLQVANNYVYVASASTTAEFSIIDASTPISPTFVKKIGLMQIANKLAVTSSTAYVAENSSILNVIVPGP
jgi:Tfp pilus assembly protein PilV